MPITWTEYEGSCTGWSRTVKSTSTTHEGLVVGGNFAREQRVMSDVYANVRYCRVWNPEKGKAEVISLGAIFECNTKLGDAEVDAPQAILDEVARQEAEAEQARKDAEEARRVEDLRTAAEREFNRPEKGKVMQVVRGRKVPKGTVGRVFWMRDGRVGLDLTGRKSSDGRRANVAWVNAEYLVNAAVEGPNYAAYGVSAR